MTMLRLRGRVSGVYTIRLPVHPSIIHTAIHTASAVVGGKAKACSASRSHTHPPNSSIQLKWCTARGCEPQTVLQAHARGYRTPRQAQAVSKGHMRYVGGACCCCAGVRLVCASGLCVWGGRMGALRWQEQCVICDKVVPPRLPTVCCIAPHRSRQRCNTQRPCMPELRPCTHSPTLHHTPRPKPARAQ